MEYPWSAIGRLNAGGRGFCTGFLVGERHVLSAAHCLYNFVEGRWLGAIELHFVAGYQHDTYSIHSGVASYERSRHFEPKLSASLAQVPHDWALLTLKKPIGRQAGWLAVVGASEDMVARAGRGDGFFLQAGYRGDRPHAITASLSCRFSGYLPHRLGLLHACDVMRGDSGSPFLLYQDGRFQAIGLHSLDIEGKDGSRAAVLSTNIFDPRGKDTQAAGAFRRAGLDRQSGAAPLADSPAAALPLKTIDRLLTILGYLHKVDPTIAERDAAVRAFQADHNFPATGAASVALLGRLVAAIP